MAFILKKTKDKTKSIYKSLYINEATADKVNRLAAENDTSFNNVVISMIEYCLKEAAFQCSTGDCRHENNM